MKRFAAATVLFAAVLGTAAATAASADAATAASAATSARAANDAGGTAAFDPPARLTLWS